MPSVFTRFSSLPAGVVWLSGAVLLAAAVRLLAPWPQALPASPFAEQARLASDPTLAARVWLPLSESSAAAIKVLAVLGSESGHGQAVLEVDGRKLAARDGEAVSPSLRVKAVYPNRVLLEQNGVLNTVSVNPK